MHLHPCQFHRNFFASPMERAVVQTLRDSFRDLEQTIRSVPPQFFDQPAPQESAVANDAEKVVNNKDGFSVELNVAQFHPEELSVKICEGDLVVEGHHNERSDDNGRIERHFIRKYAIPEDVNSEAIESHFSENGLLLVSAKKTAIEGPKARTIPIEVAERQK